MERERLEWLLSLDDQEFVHYMRYEIEGNQKRLERLLAQDDQSLVDNLRYETEMALEEMDDEVDEKPHGPKHFEFCSSCVDGCLSYLSTCNLLTADTPLHYHQGDADYLTHIELDGVEELLGRFRLALEDAEESE